MLNLRNTSKLVLVLLLVLLTGCSMFSMKDKNGVVIPDPLLVCKPTFDARFDEMIPMRGAEAGTMGRSVFFLFSQNEKGFTQEVGCLLAAEGANLQPKEVRTVTMHNCTTRVTHMFTLGEADDVIIEGVFIPTNDPAQYIVSITAYGPISGVLDFLSGKTKRAQAEPLGSLSLQVSAEAIKTTLSELSNGKFSECQQ